MYSWIVHIPHVLYFTVAEPMHIVTVCVCMYRVISLVSCLFFSSRFFFFFLSSFISITSAIVAHTVFKSVREDVRFDCIHTHIHTHTKDKCFSIENHGSLNIERYLCLFILIFLFIHSENIVHSFPLFFRCCLVLFYFICF